MHDSPDNLMRHIELGEDSSLKLQELKFQNSKIERPHRNSLADELAAMANTATGVVVLGVEDKSKAIVGIPIEQLDLVEEWVTSICNDLVKPPLLVRIRKLKVNDRKGGEKAIVRIDVPRSLFVHQSPGGYFHRIGSSKRQLAPDVLARLFQQRSQARLIRFDEQAVPNAPRDALSKALWQKFITPLSPKDEEEFLLKLKLLTKNSEGEIQPTVSGVLMATERPNDYLPNAYIQAVYYRGSERDASHQLDSQDIEGPLDEQIFAALKFVQRNMRVGAIKTPARRDIPQYSTQAVFEALVNAVAHRDYSIQGSKVRLQMFTERLEIYSPGTIPNTMTIDSLPLRQSTRNELLTSLLARCSALSPNGQESREYMMDRRGEGVPIILQNSEALSGHRPQYQLIDDSELLLTIYAAKPPHAD